MPCFMSGHQICSWTGSGLCCGFSSIQFITDCKYFEDEIRTYSSVVPELWELIKAFWTMQDLSLVYSPVVCLLGLWGVLFLPEPSPPFSEPGNIFISPVVLPLGLLRAASQPSAKTWNEWRDFFQKFCLSPSLWQLKTLSALGSFLFVCFFSSVPIFLRLKSGVPKMLMVSALLFAISLRA